MAEPQFIDTHDETVPEGEYHLRIVMQNHIGEEKEHTFILHEGRAIYQLRDLVSQGFFDGADGEPAQDIVLKVISTLLSCGESSAVEKATTLRALVDADPDYKVTGNE